MSFWFPICYCEFLTCPNFNMRNDDIPCCEVDFWVFLAISLVLVLFAGITSGLALGLLSFSQVDLEVLIKSGQFHDQKNAGCFLILYKLNHFSHCFLESLFLFLIRSKDYASYKEWAPTSMYPSYWQITGNGGRNPLIMYRFILILLWSDLILIVLFRHFPFSWTQSFHLGLLFLCQSPSSWHLQRFV